MLYDCFLCHAKEDKQFTDDLYLALRRAGLNPWMDKPPQPYEDFGISYGADWDHSIRTAIKNSALFLAILSSVSVGKRGYVQREYKLALDAMAEIPHGSIYLLPILIDECKIPDIKLDGVKFNSYQAMELHNKDLNKLVRYVTSLCEPRRREDIYHFKAQSASDLVNAVSSNCQISLAPEIGLSSATSLSGLNFRFVRSFDGLGLEIHNVDGFSIVSEQTERAHLSIEPRYANVLTFRGCTNLRLVNLKLGHFPEEGYCTGGVLEFSGCENVVIDNCEMYGCGTFGLKFDGCSNVYVNNSIIRDCCYGIADINNSSNLMFDGLRAFNNREFYGFSIVGSRDVTFRRADVLMNNVKGDLFEVIDSELIKIQNSHIVDNSYSHFSKSEQSIEIVDTLISDKI
ncbi:TIR protein [Agrobacterium albertimagni AOL15]|uniref:TIR protein n=1 Tax=Agrobacterium albertimagni AOL15 TaxID=1156935 RepID=K2QBZ1_9HYPH|nr:TIR domain-containing protein [Agrobacterium albertimagni]EKF58551.1 TIR protein [Agrobacterium albertimagni AOL15]